MLEDAMFGVCPKCHTAYHWETPRFGCACGHISAVPPVESPASDYTALGRSPFTTSPWQRDRDRDPYRDRDDSRPRSATPRPSVNAQPTSREPDQRLPEDWERDRERDQ